jgi:hypothetical protein
LRQRVGQQIELPTLEALLLNCVFKGIAFVKPAHHHQPIDHISLFPDREAARC